MTFHWGVVDSDVVGQDMHVCFLMLRCFAEHWSLGGKWVPRAHNCLSRFLIPPSHIVSTIVTVRSCRRRVRPVLAIQRARVHVTVNQ